MIAHTAIFAGGGGDALTKDCDGFFAYRIKHGAMLGLHWSHHEAA
jgi:hypothetical protein